MTQAGPASKLPAGLNLPGAQNTVNNLVTITVPPKLVPQVQTPAPTHTSPSPPSYSIDY